MQRHGGVVRCRIGALAVFWTSETMRRPLCAAEIATTSMTHQRALQKMWRPVDAARRQAECHGIRLRMALTSMRLGIPGE